MEAPTELRAAADDHEDVAITRREREDADVITIDFGPGAEATLDVVGDTAIVVAGDRQYEFEIPEEATDVWVNDGMLMIEN